MAIRIRPVAAGQTGIFDGSSALDLKNAALQVRFAIELSDPADLEALCHARRSMLREERTLGREWDEPSLEEAVFTRVEISWSVRPDQREWCLEKLDELAARANRVAGGISGD